MFVVVVYLGEYCAVFLSYLLFIIYVNKYSDNTITPLFYCLEAKTRVTRGTGYFLFPYKNKVLTFETLICVSMLRNFIIWSTFFLTRQKFVTTILGCRIIQHMQTGFKVHSSQKIYVLGQLIFSIWHKKILGCRYLKLYINLETKNKRKMIRMSTFFSYDVNSFMFYYIEVDLFLKSKS